MKKAFDIPDMLQKAEQAVSGYPKAAMFELYEKGYTSLFEQLVSCIISIRTLDETTIPVSEKLFAKARTPEQMLLLTPEHLKKCSTDRSIPGKRHTQFSALPVLPSTILMDTSRQTMTAS
jgi:endonuclease-3